MPIYHTVDGAQTGAQAGWSERTSEREKERDHVSARETELEGDKYFPCLPLLATQASIYQQSAKEVQCGGKSGR